MEPKLKERFLELWKTYFSKADLPITFYYTNDEGRAPLLKSKDGHSCFIGDLERVRKGESLSFSKNSLSCGGAMRYLGFTDELIPNFEYFLSYGIPGKLEGERYIKTPELVKEQIKHQPHFKAPGKYIVCKRWDKLEEKDQPDIVVFFAIYDVLSGLFTLSNFDESEPNSVFTPFCAGCGSIVNHPYNELRSMRPRAVLGMFDVSARPCVTDKILTFAIPISKFTRMIDNMKESFLITESWKKVRARIELQTKEK